MAGTPKRANARSMIQYYKILTFLGWMATDKLFRSIKEAEEYITAMGWENEAMQIKEARLGAIVRHEKCPR